MAYPRENAHSSSSPPDDPDPDPDPDRHPATSCSATTWSGGGLLGTSPPWKEIIGPRRHHLLTLDPTLTCPQSASHLPRAVRCQVQRSTRQVQLGDLTTSFDLSRLLHRLPEVPEIRLQRDSLPFRALTLRTVLSSSGIHVVYFHCLQCTSSTGPLPTPLMTMDDEGSRLVFRQVPDPSRRQVHQVTNTTAFFGKDRF